MSNSKNIREWSQNVVYSCGLGVSCTSYLDVKCVENLSPTSYQPYHDDTLSQAMDTQKSGKVPG